MAGVFELTDENYKKIIEDCPVFMVDCYTPLCQPCKPVAVIIDELSNEFGNDAGFGKIDISKNSTFREKYKVEIVPTILVFQRDKLVKTLGYTGIAGGWSTLKLIAGSKSKGGMPDDYHLSDPKVKKRLGKILSKYL